MMKQPRRFCRAIQGFDTASLPWQVGLPTHRLLFGAVAFSLSYTRLFMP